MKTPNRKTGDQTRDFLAVIREHYNQHDVTSSLEQFSRLQLTFGTDSSQVCDFHQHAWKHMRFVGASAAGVDLQSLQQGLLQLVHLLRLF